MLSTIDKTMKVVNGVISIVPKWYPNWHGIEGIGFISHGEWSDPEIEYKGRKCNSHDVEDTMWERFLEDGGKDQDFDEFACYMREHVYEVYELCDLAMGFVEEI